MRFNQPKAKIRFKLDSNCLLINFFDPNSSLDFEIVATKSIPADGKNIEKFDFNRKWLNLIDFFDINRLFLYKSTISSLCRLFQSFN